MRLEEVNHWYAARVPYNGALGLRAIEVMSDGLVAELPYAETLVGNPDTGVLHGGAVTSLIDATCGAAVVVALRAACRIATLDLRIDYLKPAAAGWNVVCRATCYKKTRNVAFARAVAHHGDEADPIASAAGSFMIFPDEQLADLGME
jgi:uncharacterized protein (TIGR00369 family)